MERRVLSHITPVRLRAKVVHGFGRGSKQLGFPTANLQIRCSESERPKLIPFRKGHVAR